MKKLFLLLALLPTLMFAQTDSTTLATAAQVSEVERILDKYGGKAIDAFTSLTEKVTPMAENAFDMVVRLQTAKGVGLLLPLFFAVLGWSLFMKEYKRLEVKYSDARYGPFDEDHVTPWLIVVFIFSIVLTVVAAITTYDGLLHIMAPEWYAIEDIINLVK